MKNLIFVLLFIVYPFFVISQIQLNYINFNNVRALVTNKGNIGFNPQTYTPNYEVPVGSSNNVLFAHTPLWVAKDGNGNLLGSFSYYNSNTVMAGPISSNYSSSWQMNKRSIYNEYNFDIQNHIINYDQPGYTMPAEIAEWPADGNVQESGSAFLAPFEDVNQNGEYDPENGDYPIIYGDHMVFSIFNFDSLPNTTLPGTQPSSIEVQMGTYQFATNDDINNTTFVYYRIENKSQDTLFDFQWGNMSDFDIGSSQDDLFGSDINRNMIYAYNGAANDPGGNGQPGYGPYPPAAGIISLNNDMYVTNYVGDPNNNPDHEITTLTELNFALQGKNSQGVMNTDINGAPVKMLYNESPTISGSYSEYQEGNMPGERRLLYASAPYDLKPGESKCYHYAIIYKRTFQNDNIEIVDSLLATADLVQDFFNNQIDPTCYEKPTLSIDENYAKQEIMIYPNPTVGVLHINHDQPLDKVRISDNQGKIIKTFEHAEHKISTAGLDTGVYYVSIHSAGRIHRKKLMIK